MKLEPSLLHPRIVAGDFPTAAERVYLDALQALADSLRSPEEMSEAASVLNPLLDAREKNPNEVDALAARIRGYAHAVRDARSGMACDLALDYLRLGLDEAREFLIKTAER